MRGCYRRGYRVLTHALSAHLLLIFACTAWGGSYAVGRFGLNDGSALWLALWRWGPGALVFVVFLYLTWDTYGRHIRTNLTRLTFISVFGVVIYPTTLFLAVAETTALNAALYLSVTPVLIVLMSRLIWSEAMGGIGALSVCIGLLGALVLVFRGSFDAMLTFQFATTDVWAIVSAFAWAGYCVSLPMKPKELSELSFLAALIVIGTAILLMLAVVWGGTIPMPDTAITATSMAYFAIFPSILAFLAWNQGTTRVGPSVAAPYNNLVPFVGGAMGVLLLEEALESYHILGGGLVALSLVLNARRS